MDFAADPDWRRRYRLASHAVTPGERNALARLAASGAVRRVAPGIYRPGGLAASPDDAYREQVYAHELRTGGRRVFSHESAAVLWRLPLIGAWPDAVHVADGVGGGHSSRSVRRHASGIPAHVDRIDGIRVTHLVRTIVDIARSRPFADGVAVLDAALGGVGSIARVTRVALTDAVSELGPGDRGSVRARHALELADDAAGSPGESLSRVSIHRAGFPRPVLQHRIEDRAGAMFVDFCWPEHRLVGEFDGAAKYLRSDWTGGRTAAEVVVDEKWREDRIRALGWRVVRWGWDAAGSPTTLAPLLTDAGLPRASAHPCT